MGKKKEKKLDFEFLAINKAYFNLELKSIDLLILCQIEEYQRNEEICYLTNEQFSYMFGESKDTVKRSLTKLEDLNMIKRVTTFVKGNGRANRQRTLSVNPVSQWKVQNKPTIEMEGANLDNGRCKNQQWKVHNAPIKDNLKDNIKDNSRRELESLSVEELHSIIDDSKKHMKYIDIQKKYNLSSMVTKDTQKQCESIIKDRNLIIQQQLEREERAKQPKINYEALYRQRCEHEAVTSNIDINELIEECTF